MTCPRLDQRAVHAEVLTRQPVLLLRNGQHFIEKLDYRVMLDHPFMALLTRKPENLIQHLHSDQESQYTRIAFGQRCQLMGVHPSIGTVGDACQQRL